MGASKIKFFNREEQILIYTLGKVGSSSLEKSVEGSIHLHSLYHNPPNPVHWKLRNYGWLNTRKGYAKDYIKRIALKSGREIKIISLVRDPLERNISMFFQALPFWLAFAQSGFGRKQLLGSRGEGTEVLIDAFSNCFNHAYPLDWFDKEIKRFTGIDIFERGFDKGEGCSVYKNGKYSLMVLRLEELDSKSEAIGDFLGKKVVLKKSNDSSNKWYRDAYRKFKEEYVPSPEMLDLLYGSKYYTTFFNSKLGL